MTLRGKIPITMKTQETAIQAKAFDFALGELVRNNRETFEPVWTVDSWVKFLIWLALNCGLSGDKQSLELFADALGAPLTYRMRRLFFERNFDSLCVMGDPAEASVLIYPSSSESHISFDSVNFSLVELGLIKLVNKDQTTWSENQGVITIPWK